MNKTALLVLLIHLLTRPQNFVAQTFELTPLCHTIGVKVENIGAADSCRVEYKNAAFLNWQLAFNPDKIVIDNTEQFRGGIFMLEENTPYQVRVTVFNGSNGIVLPTSQTTTLKSPSYAPTNNIKWVSPTGTGDYTTNNPGNLNTLFSTGQVSCGTTILFTSGIYNTNGLQLTISNHCTENTPIVLMAAPGANPIIDGGAVITTTWIEDANYPNLYSTALPNGAGHSNICILGNTALYPYPTLAAHPLLGDFNLRELNFGYDGFVRNENKIWIKTYAGINPNLSTVVVSKSFRFLIVYGNNKNAFLKIKGIEFRYFGKPVLNSLGSNIDAYSAVAFDLRNVHHISFDSCRFLYNNGDIYFSGENNHLTIQNSYFKHDAGKWSHAMVKKSHDHIHTIFGTEPSSRGRNIETAAIFLERGNAGIIRNNIFDGLNSGIASFNDYGLKQDIDIYQNKFIDNFDAIECDGLWTNLRAWNNEIIRPMAGISAAPPLVGPRYFYRNTIHGMQGRRNEQFDPHFVGCTPVGSNYSGQGVGIKTNPKYTGSIPTGNLYFFNNTFHAVDTLGFVMTSWESEWRKAVFINNAYSHSLSYPFFYFDLADQLTNGNFQMTSIHDNYFSYSSNAPIVKVKHLYEQYNCSEIDTVEELQYTLSSISGSPNILIQNPIQADPHFISTSEGGFELSDNSPLIDAGTIIQGFYDYTGTKPDIGAKENNSTTRLQQELFKSVGALVYPNPADDKVNIALSNSFNDVSIDVFNHLGQNVCNFHLLSGQLFEIDLSHLPNGFYFLSICVEHGKVLKKILKMGI